MARVKYTTTIDEDLLNMAKGRAGEEGFEGANAIIEKALKLYFANCTVEVWEKRLSGGWFKKIVVRPSGVTFESIRSRQFRTRFNPAYYTPEILEPRGYRKVFAMQKDQKASG